MNISVNDFAPDCVDDFATDWQCDQYVYAGESGGGGGQPNLCENPGETSDEQGMYCQSSLFVVNNGSTHKMSQNHRLSGSIPIGGNFFTEIHFTV